MRDLLVSNGPKTAFNMTKFHIHGVRMQNFTLCAVALPIIRNQGTIIRKDTHYDKKQKYNN